MVSDLPADASAGFEHPDALPNHPFLLRNVIIQMNPFFILLPEVVRRGRDDKLKSAVGNALQELQAVPGKHNDPPLWTKALTDLDLLKHRGSILASRPSLGEKKWSVSASFPTFTLLIFLLIPISGILGSRPCRSSFLQLDSEPNIGSIVPRMGSASSTENIGAALWSKGRRELLALLFTHPDRSFYLRQIVRLLGSGQGVVQRELSRLSKAAVITRTRVGSQVHYQANRESPVFGELKSLMVKTAGVAEVLRDSIAGLADQIEVAFIFGSFSRAEDRANSDVDVMVVGSVSFGDVVSAFQPAQERIGREVNPAVFSVEEYRARARSRNRFLGSVLNSPRIFLIGGENELKRLG